VLARTGVCRDFAHLGVAICRALGIPARYTAVYAPGLDPMDFHAVFEAAIDNHWYVFDGTRLAPRASLARIGSGRDAADVALLTPAGATLRSLSQDLTVTSSPHLPTDDRGGLVTLP
jgi:transglutaminase-like putative cysteine protease